ncbi:hypothetical protein [Streptomyces noursei]|uniref:hypothetical protein n=1 Tax=Streptomyces noursei TaxID=1971 RepID=UPI00167BE62B|nr:hypothetical protein [Streptomyces noursei]MCZ1021274.1 hypothetical protein [Streptomyces noursei]GGX57556.1 hypothetical protein GCM10010341_91880 [Streptomyces noursei]
MTTPLPPYKYAGIYALDPHTDAGWQAMASVYEQDLGARLAMRDEVKTAAQATIIRMYDVLAQDYQHNSKTPLSMEKAREKAATAFFADDPKSAGQIGSYTGGMAYLTGQAAEKPTVREMMTALFNAAYFASNSRKDKASSEDISLKNTVQRIYFNSSTTPERDAQTLDLNHAYLASYTDYLTNNTTLNALRKLFTKQHAFDKDVFALGSLALYSSSHYKEYQLCQIARGWRDPQGKYTYPADYLRLGSGTGLSAAERDHLGKAATILLLEGFDATFTQNDESLKPEQIADMKTKCNVIDVQNSYWYDPDGTKRCLGYVTITAKQITTENVRASDLDHAAAAGPEYPLPWSEGWKSLGINPGSLWYKEYCLNRGYPLIAGLSGTAARMFSAFAWLNVPNCPALDFAKALLAWMLPTRDHSLYEILKAIHIATLNTKNQNETTSPSGQYRKQRLLPHPIDNTEIDALSAALKQGAAPAYPAIEKLLGLMTRDPNILDTSTPDPLSIITQKINTYVAENGSKRKLDQSPLGDINGEDVMLISAMAKYIPMVDDPNNPPSKDRIQEEMNPREFDALNRLLNDETEITRVEEINRWLKRMGVAGPDIAPPDGSGFAVASVCGIYAYTTATYALINSADKSPNRFDGIRDAALRGANKALDDLEKGTVTYSTCVTVMESDELGGYFDKAADACYGLSKDPTKKGSGEKSQEGPRGEN